MAGQDPAAEQRRAQASQWFARLKTVPVSMGTLDAFFEWRRDPGNADAFAEVEQFWSEADSARGSPAMLRLADEAMARAPARGRRWPLVPTIVLAAALLLALGLGSWKWSRGASDIAVETALGEQRSVALGDGSQLQLNTATRIDARLAGTERRVRIDEGEAIFEIAHDRDRPFLVNAGDVEVRATGTRFDVRHIAGETIVALFEGGVEIRDAGSPPVLLRPGQQWRSTAPPARRVGEVDTHEVTAWTQGRLVFDATPLAMAVAEVNRYTSRKVVLAAGAPVDAPISGSFTTGDPTGFVKAVSAMLDLQPAPSAQGGIALAPRTRTAR